MPTDPPLQPDAGLSLAMAMLSSSTVPLVLLDGGLNVIGMSSSFCRAFDIVVPSAIGRPFLGLGSGEWDSRQLRSLLETTASGDVAIEAYEFNLEKAGREPPWLVLNARKLHYADPANVRLLLTVADVTDARIAERLKDDLLREKAVLLQEVQHRVANSLQIIASVILQNARRVQSEETRGHLHDAHQRVMSVAVLQQQLAMSRQGDVALRPYFTGLCKIISASMIRDHNQISLEVIADDSTISADASVGLGLIVTELVINALKHAFPTSRRGKVVVGYTAEGPNWTMSVADDGIGMPGGPENATPGLGTSIVEALAKQLHARVRVADARPGTTVSIIYLHKGEVASGPGSPAGMEP